MAVPESFFFFDFICIPEHVCSTKTSRPWPLHDEEGGNGGCMRAVLDHCSQLGSQVPYQRRLAGVYPSWWGSGPGRPRTQGGPSRYAVVLIPAVGLRVDFWCAGEPWALRRLAVPPESAAPVNVERSESRVDPGSVVARVQ